MADSETTQTAAAQTSLGNEPQTQPPPAAEQAQVTSKIPTSTPVAAKNPKRVAAGKAVAAKTKQAREAQKEAAEAAEAAGLVPSQNRPKAPPNEEAAASTNEDTTNVVTTTQWLSIISIFVSIINLYYKREEIKKVFNPQPAPPQPVLAQTRLDEMQAPASTSRSIPVDTQLTQTNKSPRPKSLGSLTFINPVSNKNKASCFSWAAARSLSATQLSVFFENARIFSLNQCIGDINGRQVCQSLLQPPGLLERHRCHQKISGRRKSP